MSSVRAFTEARTNRQKAYELMKKEEEARILRAQVLREAQIEKERQRLEREKAEAEERMAMDWRRIEVVQKARQATQSQVESLRAALDGTLFT